MTFPSCFTGILLFGSFGIVLQGQQADAPASGVRDLSLTVGKSVVVESPIQITRVSVADGSVAEAVATSPKEVLVIGKAPGETSLIVWQQGDKRLFFDLTIRPNPMKTDAVKRELRRELGDQDVSLEVQGDNVFVKGAVSDLTSADRALRIAATLGKPVNLLRVAVPETETQILIKVKFANVERGATRDLGLNLFSTGATGTIGRISTGQFGSATANAVGPGVQSQFNLSDLLNIFLFRPDLNLGLTIKALQDKRLLEVLAEPNVLAINGQQASFLAGGEFPYPILQGGGGGLGYVTIQFKEFGVRITFTPVVTPRGTIRMQVTPEVSSLDYANGLNFQGFTIPGLDVRRVSTQVELESGQTFAIGGLLDNRVTETLSKIPGIGDIPFFGKLFQSQQRLKNNTELLVMVTPEVVRPIPAGQPLPALHFPEGFLPPNTPGVPMQQPGMGATGPVPLTSHPVAIPMEELVRSQRMPASQTGTQAQPQVQFMPVLMQPAGQGGEATAAPVQSVPATPAVSAPKQ